MSLGFWVNLLNVLGDYRIDEKKCTRIKSRKSNCDACEKACPMGCIKVGKEIEIEEGCKSCGICSSVCPTKAIVKKNSTLEYIHYKMNEGKLFSIDCREKNPKGDSYFDNFCIGSLNDEYILYILLHNPSLLKDFDSTKCENCKLSSGYKSFLDRKEKMEKRLEESFVNKKNFLISASRKTETEEYDVDKRALLKSVFAVKSRWDEIDSKEKELSKAHSVLDELLEKDLKVFELMDLTFPMAGNGQCDQCEACVNLCPVKALQMKGTVISVDTKNCCHCGLCERVCFEKAISMGQITCETYLSGTYDIF